MSSFNRQQINNIVNGTHGSTSVIDVNTTVASVDPTAMYSMYTALNATIDAYAGSSATVTADTTNLFDISNEDVFKRLDATGNDTDDDGLLRENHVFDRTDVRAIFIIMYSLVFCCCFFGEYKLCRHTLCFHSYTHNKHMRA